MAEVPSLSALGSGAEGAANGAEGTEVVDWEGCDVASFVGTAEGAEGPGDVGSRNAGAAGSVVAGGCGALGSAVGGSGAK